MISIPEFSTDVSPAIVPIGDVEFVWRLNNRGSSIPAGAPCCLDHAATGNNRGVYATIPSASNLALFEGVWLPYPDGTTTIPNGAYARVQRRGMVMDPATGNGLARVLGSAGISAAGKFLMYTATNDYFQIFADLYTDLEEQAAKILSGEAYTTASVANKVIWLKG